ncbi:hypothetical protein GCM10028801_10620 [Nocardioides maradonensis]
MSYKSVLRALALLVVVLCLPAAPAHAVTWTQVDRACKNLDAGQICATVWTDGSGNYRARSSATPAAGQWLQPTMAATYNVNMGSGEYFCDPNQTCARQTSAWTSTYSTWSGRMWTYSGSFNLPGGGTAEVAAGAASWEDNGTTCTTVTSGRACVTLRLRTNRAAVDIRSVLTLTPASGRRMTPTQVRASLTSGSTTWTNGTALSGARTTTYTASVTKLGATPRSSWSATAYGSWTDTAGAHTVRKTL